MEIDASRILREFVDYLMPELKPHETAVYVYLLTKSYLSIGSASVRLACPQIMCQLEVEG